jgi:hypothetical protein
MVPVAAVLFAAAAAAAAIRWSASQSSTKRSLHWQQQQDCSWSRYPCQEHQGHLLHLLLLLPLLRQLLLQVAKQLHQLLLLLVVAKLLLLLLRRLGSLSQRQLNLEMIRWAAWLVGHCLFPSLVQAKCIWLVGYAPGLFW